MEKNQTIAIAVVAILLVAAVGVGWYVLSGDDEQNQPAEITDAMGNVVKLDGVPERIVSTSAVPTEILCDLGFRSNLVGATSNFGIYDVFSDIYGIDLDFDYPATIEADMASGKVANIGKWSWAVEDVLAANPNLVIMDEDQLADINKMKDIQKVGVDVIVLDADSGFDVIKDNYMMLGKALGAVDRAEDICSEIDDALKVIDNRFDEKSNASITFAAISYMPGYIYGYGDGGMVQALKSAGYTNAFKTTDSFFSISYEDIAAANPDVIIFEDMGSMLDWAPIIESWKADPVMGSIDAIKNDDFYCLEYGPFRACGYSTVHMVEGYALLPSLMEGAINDSGLPNIVDDKEWRKNIEWLKEAA